MKYLLMMHTPTGGAYQIMKWPPEAIRAHIGHMKDLVVKLQQTGELVSAEGLAGPDQAKLVKAGKDGQPVTDGVFPETKEFLAGYWFVQVDRPERAYEIAADASLAPGADGQPLHLSIEVREVMSAPPSDS